MMNTYLFAYLAFDNVCLIEMTALLALLYGLRPMSCCDKLVFLNT